MATHRFSDNGAPGLMIYGLHNDLLSTDSDDTDYSPGKSFISSDSSDEDSDGVLRQSGINLFLYVNQT